MRSHRAIGNCYLVLLLRLMVGGVWILAGSAKFKYLAEQTQLVDGYGVLPLPLILVDTYVRVLPWVEILTGCCLVLGLFSRFFIGVSIFLLVTFIGANSIFLYYQGNADCGCLGQLLPISHSGAIALDMAMLAAALFLLFSRYSSVGLDSWLSQRREQGQ